MLLGVGGGILLAWFRCTFPLRGNRTLQINTQIFTDGSLMVLLYAITKKSL